MMFWIQQSKHKEGIVKGKAQAIVETSLEFGFSEQQTIENQQKLKELEAEVMQLA